MTSYSKITLLLSALALLLSFQNCSNVNFEDVEALSSSIEREAESKTNPETEIELEVEPKPEPDANGCLPGEPSENLTVAKDHNGYTWQHQFDALTGKLTSLVGQEGSSSSDMSIIEIANLSSQTDNECTYKEISAKADDNTEEKLVLSACAPKGSNLVYLFSQKRNEDGGFYFHDLTTAHGVICHKGPCPSDVRAQGLSLIHI